MALSSVIKLESYNSLLLRYTDQLNETDKQVLELINDIAAEDDIPLYKQHINITDHLIKLIKASQTEKNDDLPGTSFLIYSLVTELMASQSVVNRNRHLSQGHFDLTALHHRAIRDQMQDHDMTLIMPKSIGNISVFAVLNRFDPSSADSIHDVLASELFNDNIDHIIIPVGPGHWRGVYLTKPSPELDELLFDVELFDPYGPTGAAAIDAYILNLLANCGIPKELISIRHTGPAHPQGDAYSCGDFTNAHSHKKMKEFGAPKGSYNENLVNTLENLGNIYDTLRFMTREEIKYITNKGIQHSAIENPVASHDNSKKSEKSTAVPGSKTTQSVLSALGTKSSTPVDTLGEKDKSAPITNKVKQPQKVFTPEHKTIPNTKLSSATPIGLKVGGIAGGTFLGALIGGLVGFFGLPVIGAPIGAAIGAGIGALIGLTVVGLTHLFGGTTSNSDAPKNTASTSTTEDTDSYSHAYDNDYNQAQDKEPIISPPLFSKVAAKATPVSQNKVDESELIQKGPR